MKQLAVGYIMRFMPDGHPNANGSGYVMEHVRIAAIALGRAIPRGCDVHHVDGNKSNNANSNLVICDSGAYHRLLHFRMRVLAAGGDPDTERVCGKCRKCLPFAKFSLSKNSYCHYCKSCSAIQTAAWQKANPERVREQRAEFKNRRRLAGKCLAEEIL